MQAICGDVPAGDHSQDPSRSASRQPAKICGNPRPVIPAKICGNPRPVIPAKICGNPRPVIPRVCDDPRHVPRSAVNPRPVPKIRVIRVP
jgi:hypothetical protein